MSRDKDNPGTGQSQLRRIKDNSRTRRVPGQDKDKAWQALQRDKSRTPQGQLQGVTSLLWDVSRPSQGEFKGRDKGRDKR